VCILADKEEIGSVGNTGMQSRALEYFVTEILEACGQNSLAAVSRTFAATRMLSADVSAGVDPTYESVSEKKNAAYIGRGVCITK
jgi:aspartyl aminopeptidase